MVEPVNGHETGKKQLQVGLILAGCFIFLFAIRAWTTPAMTVASMSYLFLLGGLAVRRVNTRLHAGLMATGMAIDVLLVLTLQIQRHAVQTAVSESLNVFQYVHVMSSLLATTGYVPSAILGYRLLKKQSERAKWLPVHLRIAGLTFAFRTVGFITMFAMLGRK